METREVLILTLSILSILSIGLSKGMHFLIHPQGQIYDERMAIHCLESTVYVFRDNRVIYPLQCCSGYYNLSVCTGTQCFLSDAMFNILYNHEMPSIFHYSYWDYMVVYAIYSSVILESRGLVNKIPSVEWITLIMYLFTIFDISIHVFILPLTSFGFVWKIHF